MLLGMCDEVEKCSCCSGERVERMKTWGLKGWSTQMRNSSGYSSEAVEGRKGEQEWGWGWDKVRGDEKRRRREGGEEEERRKGKELT